MALEKHFTVALIVLACLGALTGFAFGQPQTLPEINPDDIGSIVGGAFDAFRDGSTAWGVGLVFMALTWVFRVFVKTRLPKGIWIWIAVGLATATSIATGLASGSGIWNAIGAGVTAGLAAGGGWAALGKYIPGAKKATVPKEER